MSENLMDKVSSLGEKLKIGGSGVGAKLSAGMSSMSFKMKEFFQGGNHADKLVEEATAEALDDPDWSVNLELCDMINNERINSIDMIRGIKKRIMLKNPRVQYLSLVLLETVVKNCDKAFSEVAAERILEEMVKLIDDPQTNVNNRTKALILIEAWGESSNELRYLPVYETTYKALKSKGIRFPGRDNESLAPIFTPPRLVTAPESYARLAQEPQHDISQVNLSREEMMQVFDVARNSVEILGAMIGSLQKDAVKDDVTLSLVEQCNETLISVQRIIETAGDDESILCKALESNDELLRILSKYEDLKKPCAILKEPGPAMIPIATEPYDSPHVGKEEALIRKPPSGSRNGGQMENNNDMMDDLDEMIFGKVTVEGQSQPPKDNRFSL